MATAVEPDAPASGPQTPPMSVRLHEPFERSAATHPGRLAFVDPARAKVITYEKLSRLVDDLALDITRVGVGDGQRVGIYAPKSIPSAASILATLKAGGAYVPIDASAPPRRGAEILSDCGVAAVVADRKLAAILAETCGSVKSCHEFGVSAELAALGDDLVLLACESSQPSPVEGLAYILYTSGSTGSPKGVMHTHASARCFVDWCSETFEPTSSDRFSSHAPFHFDLSIFDLYVPLTHGATIVLIGEEDGKNPLRLAPLIGQTEISIWYSTPSVLRLLLEHGGPERSDPKNLRLVLFAGEVFSAGHLRRLQNTWPGRRYFNLYGPTETNVCTSYEVIGEVPADRRDPYPIGKAIRGDETIVVDGNGHPVTPGEEGELLVTGGTVMAGYWNRPESNVSVFLLDEQHRRWYRTGDIVREDEHDDYIFMGRRDRMIKRRGYRVELGEIETALYRHPFVQEAAVIAETDGAEVRVRAFVCWNGGRPPSIVEMKQFCAKNLPLYMVPDSFTFLKELPKTSTDKIDYLSMRSFDG